MDWHVGSPAKPVRLFQSTCVKQYVSQINQERSKVFNSLFNNSVSYYFYSRFHISLLQGNLTAPGWTKVKFLKRFSNYERT